MRWPRFFGGRSAVPAVSPTAAVPRVTGPRAEALILGDLTSEALAEFMRQGGETASGASVTPDSALTVSAVYRCVAIISGAIATLPCRLMRDRGGVKEKAKDHPLYRLLKKRPNRWQTSAQFRRMMTAHVLLRGNAYALKVKVGTAIVALLPLHPDRVEPLQGPNLEVVYRYTRPDGGVQVFSREEIFHLADLTLDGVKGLSRVRLMREAIGAAKQMETFGAKLFKNGAFPGAAVKVAGALSDEAFARLQAQIEEQRGAENGHKTLIFEEGMDWTQLALTSEDAQFLQSRQFTKAEIATFFGVPPHLLGDTEKSTSWGSGIAEQNMGFVQFTLLEHIVMWEETADRDLLTEQESRADELYVHLNPKGWLRVTADKQADVYAKALGAGGHAPYMTVNEVRALEDLPPLPGGDVLPPPATLATRPSEQSR